MKKQILAALMLAGAATAQAAVITPDTASASSEFSTQYRALYTIDGSGFAGPVTPSSLHADYATNNHWTTDGTAPLDEFIDWGFNAPQTLGTIYIWNHRSNIIANNSGYEVTLFDLMLFDSANNILLNLDNVSLLPDTDASQAIAFTLTNNVSRVRLAVEQTQSSTNYTGLAEVRFDTTSVGASSPVPEPSTYGMAAVAMAVFGWARRRRR
ncbi:MAG: PEP-CTERM sorting domain-containing protein [Bryobacterales bacterium]|nr:PEP-CTERM sorting domain-containing protein [Bryobacterales bacterium]